LMVTFFVDDCFFLLPVSSIMQLSSCKEKVNIDDPCQFLLV